MKLFSLRGLKLKRKIVLSSFLLVTQASLCTIGLTASGIDYPAVRYVSSVGPIPPPIHKEYKPEYISTVNAVYKEVKLDDSKSKWVFGRTREVIWGDRSKNEIALTFDDGFDRKSIERALDVLKNENIKCTFFVVGEALKDNPDLWKRAVAEGHQICNHTHSHTFLSGLSDEKVRAEISEWETDAKNVLGESYFEKMKHDFPFMRLPGGSGSKSKRILKVVSDLKYIPVSWADETVSSILNHYDLKKVDSSVLAPKITNHVVGYTMKGTIILLHFNIYDTRTLTDTIEGIKKKGYILKQVSDIISASE